MKPCIKREVRWSYHLCSLCTWPIFFAKQHVRFGQRMTPKTHPIFQHVKKLPPKTKTSIIPDFWITLNEILTDFKHQRKNDLNGKYPRSCQPCLLDARNCLVCYYLGWFKSDLFIVVLVISKNSLPHHHQQPTVECLERINEGSPTLIISCHTPAVLPLLLDPDVMNHCSHSITHILNNMSPNCKSLSETIHRNNNFLL